MPGFFIKFSIRQDFNDFGEGSNFSMKWAIFCNFGVFFCMRFTKTLQHYKHYTIFLRQANHYITIYKIINTLVI